MTQPHRSVLQEGNSWMPCPAIHHPGKWLCSDEQTSFAKGGGASSCMKWSVVTFSHWQVTGHTCNRHFTKFTVYLKMKDPATVVHVIPHETDSVTLILLHTITAMPIHWATNMSKTLITPQKVLKQLWPINIPTHKAFCKLHLCVTVTSKPHSIIKSSRVWLSLKSVQK